MQRITGLFALCCCVLVLFGPKALGQWRAINTGLNGSDVSALYAHNGIVYEVGSNGTIYRSVDGCNHWQVSGVDLIGYGDLSMASTAHYDILSNNGVWLTTDGGLTWKPRGLDSISFMTMFVRGDTVLGATNNGLYTSGDQGLHWQQSTNSGRPSKVFISFAQVGSVVISATTDSVYVSKDDGESWQAISTFDVNKVGGVSMVSQGDTLLACVNHDHLFVSMDSAQSWYASNVPPGTRSVQIHDSLLIAMDGYRMYYSSDFGLSWTQRKNLSRSYGNEPCAWLGDTLLLGNAEGVFRSTDHGYNWTKCISGLENTTVWSMCLSSNLLYAGTKSNGAYRSSDNGEHWEAMADTSRFDDGVPCMYSMGDTVFAATQGRGLFASSDRGQSWNVVNSGISSGSYTRAIAGANGVFLLWEWDIWRRHVCLDRSGHSLDLA